MSDMNLTLRLRVNADGSVATINGVSNAVRGVGSDSDRSSAAMGRLSGAVARVGHYAIGLAGINIGADKVRDTLMLADKMTLLDSRIRIATSSLNDYRGAGQALTSISLATGSSLESNITMFGRLNKSVESMGGSYKTTLSLTKTLSEALKISGASADEAKSVMIQLSQALSSGVLRGDELNGVMENGARVVDALSLATGKTRGELRKMAEEGQLSAQLVVNALQSQAKAIHDDFGKIPITIGAALENLDTHWSKFIEHINTSTESTAGLSKNLQELGEMLHVLDRGFTGANTAEDRVSVLNVEIGKIAEKLEKVDKSLPGFYTASYVTSLKEEMLGLVRNRDKLTESIKAQATEEVKLKDVAVNSVGEQIKLEDRLRSIQEGKYKNKIIDVAEQEHVDPNFMLAVAQQETGSKGTKDTVSSAGARGLMQIMPDTAAGLAKQMHVAYDQIYDDLETHLHASAKLIKQNADYLEHEGKLTVENLAAMYNASPKSLKKYDFNKLKFPYSEDKSSLYQQTKPYMENVAEMTVSLNKYSGTDFFKDQGEAAEKAGEEVKKFAEKRQQTIEQLSSPLEEYQAKLAELQDLKLPDNVFIAGANKATEQYTQESLALERTKQSYLEKFQTEKLIKEQVSAADDAYYAKQLADLGYSNEMIKDEIELYHQLLAAKTANPNLPAGVAIEATANTIGSKNILNDLSGNKVDSPVNTKALDDYNNLITKVINSTNQLGATNSAVFDGALGGINSLVGAFDNMTAAIKASTGAQEELNAQKADALANIHSSNDDEFGKTVKEKKVLFDFDVASKKLTQDKVNAELTGARQIIGATANMLDQKSHAAKALHMIEQGIAVAQMSQNAATMASNLMTAITGTTAGAAQMFAQSGWAGFAGVAAMLGVMAGLGFSGGGGGLLPSIEQSNPTTGTVLGDKSAESHSIGDVYGLLKDIHGSEYRELRGINEGVSNLHDNIIAAVTGVFQRENLSLPYIAPSTEDVKNEISQNRIIGGKINIGDLFAGQKLDLTHFIETKSTEDGLFWTSVDVSEIRNKLSAETSRAFEDIFINSGKVMIETGRLFKLDVDKAVKDFTFPALNVDLKGLTGDEAQKRLNAVVSTMLDDANAAMFPEFLRFQKIGEGMAGTMGRLGTEVGVLENSYNMVGVQFAATGVDAAQLALDLIGTQFSAQDAVSALKDLRGNFEDFFSKFYSAGEQFGYQGSTLLAHVNDLKLVLPGSRDGWRQLVQQTLAAGESSAATASELLTLTGAADEYYNYLKGATDIFLKLGEQLNGNKWSAGFGETISRGVTQNAIDAFNSKAGTKFNRDTIKGIYDDPKQIVGLDKFIREFPLLGGLAVDVFKAYGNELTATTNLTRIQTDATSALSKSSEEAAKKVQAVADVQKTMSDRVKELSSSDMQNSIAGIDSKIASMLKTAVDNGGQLVNAGSYRSAEVKNIFKPFFDEFNNIGKTDLDKSLGGITLWTQQMLAVAPEIATAYNITKDQAISGINAIAAARTKDANKALNDARMQQQIQLMELAGDKIGALNVKRQLEIDALDKSLQADAGRINMLNDWNAIVTEFNAIGKTEAQKSVDAARQFYDDNVKQITIYFNKGLLEVGNGISALGTVLLVFQSRINAITADIDKANRAMLAAQGKTQAENDVANIFQKYFDNQASISAVDATSKKTANDAYATAQQYINTIKAQIDNWLGQWSSNNSIQTLQGLVDGSQSFGDILHSVIPYIESQIQESSDALAWFNQNLGTLNTFAGQLEIAFGSLTTATNNYNVALGSSTATVSTTNISAMWADVIAYFKPMVADANTLQKSDYQNALDGVTGYVNNWAAAIKLAESTALNLATNAVDKTNISANVNGFVAQLALVQAAKNAAIEKQYRQPLETRIYTLGHSKVDALAYTRKLELQAMDATLRPLQEMVNTLTDLRDAAAKTQDAIKSASTSLTDLIDRLKAQTGQDQGYSQAKSLLQATLAQAQAGNFDGLDKAVTSLSILANDQSKYFATAIDYRREQQSNINALQILKALADNKSTSLDTISVPGFAFGGDHAGGLRVVGERGPELEFTGPSHIMNNSGSMRVLSNEELVKELQDLKKEHARYHDEIKQLNIQLVRHTKKSADLAEKNESIGTPPVRA